MVAIDGVAQFTMVLTGDVLVASFVAVLVAMVLRVVGCFVEVGLGPLLLSGLVQGRVVDVVVLDAVLCVVLHFVEQFIELVFHVALQGLASMILNIVGVGVSCVPTVAVGVGITMSSVLISVSVAKVADLEVASIGVLGHVLVLIMVYIVSPGIMFPVVWAMLNTMSVMVLIHVLRVMITLILLVVVVAHVVGALRLDIVVLTVLLASEVTFITNVRLMVLQVPVALLKVSARVLFNTVGQNFSLKLILGVIVLIRSLLTLKIVCGKVLFRLRLILL